MGTKRRNRKKHHSVEKLESVTKATVEVTATHLASPWIHDFILQRAQWQSLFLETIEAASSITSRDISSELFNAYLFIGSRWFSHHESVEMLLNVGRYGDCMILLRSLLEDTDLITFFACFPNEAAEWNERLSRAPVWSDEVYKKGIQKYKTTSIWKKLKAKGIKPSAETDYSILSATVHASPWGARFYGKRLPGDPEQLYLTLAPIYDAAAAFSACLVLQGTYPKPIWAFLRYCAETKAPQSLWRPIKARYGALIGNWESKMEFDSWFRRDMERAEERVLQGENPEDVLQELRKNIVDKYGEPEDTDDDEPS